LPASTGITFKYKKAYETNFSTDLTSITDSVLLQVRAEKAVESIASYQLRIEFTVSSNNAPEVESVGYLEPNEE
jgi:hypothetical protein